MSKPDKVQGIVTVPEPSQEEVNERQLIAYKAHREKYINWLSNMGKDPDALEGYSHHTAKNHASIVDKFHRRVWNLGGGYTLDITHDHADEYIENLVLSDEEYSDSYLHNVKLALKAFFRFKDPENEWECEITITSSDSATNPKDYLTAEERKAFREASLEFGTIPAYSALSPEERDEWKKFLARRYGMAANDVTESEWDRANGFKYPSIIHTALDGGLRPIEVGRAKVGWVDIDNALLRMPKEESSKGVENWTVSIREETAEYLARWLEEREMYEKYDDTDRLWLTRHANQYKASSLRYLMDSISELVGVQRDVTWYAIRHSTGTYMTREEGLAAAQSQLRHKETSTTMKYDQVPNEDRRDALDRMG